MKRKGAHYMFSLNTLPSQQLVWELDQLDLDLAYGDWTNWDTELVREILQECAGRLENG